MKHSPNPQISQPDLLSLYSKKVKFLSASNLFRRQRRKAKKLVAARIGIALLNYKVNSYFVAKQVHLENPCLFFGQSTAQIIKQKSSKLGITTYPFLKILFFIKFLKRGGMQHSPKSQFSRLLLLLRS